MRLNLLFTLSDLKLFHPVEDLGDMLFKVAFGFVFVVVGIAVLILIFSILGLIMKKMNARKLQRGRAHKKGELTRPAPEKPAEPEEAAEGLSPELLAVITAAIAAYYGDTKEKGDFVVRRIKRL